MDNKKTIYLQKARLIVRAHGYWYTSGGEKGPFGFYPHLKDMAGYPVYPDTQLHGDLRMAARWLSKIEDAFTDAMIIEVFGDEPKGRTRQVPSKLFLTDLTLDKKSKEKWEPKRFEVKPRIAIDETTRTVEEHMLVFQEMAYLEGLTLTADVYLGYFKDKEALDKARNLIDSTIPLLSGFGQSRSRGYGRGELSIQWDDVEFYSFEQEERSDLPDAVLYTLKSLVHFRNKPVEPGSTQFLPARRVISSEQIKGWFSRIYFDLFGVWPSVHEMGLIEFSNLYPSLTDSSSVSIGYPSAMTTLKNEENKVRDILNREITQAEKDVEDSENFFKTKTKPLSEDYFITSNSNLKTFKVETERRIRNQIEDNFATSKEGGLFVQELIKKDTSFGGIIRINKEKGFEDFLSRAVFIIKKVKPIINGCLFQMDYKETTRDMADTEGPWLAVKPISFNPEVLNFFGCGYEKQGERIVLNGANIITLKSIKRYNTTLKRPKRPRITIKPGSVLLSDAGVFKKDSLVAWKGFGKDLEMHIPTDSSLQRSHRKKEKPQFEISKDILEELKNMTPSQAGFLKEFLNRHRKIEEIKRLSDKRKEKYDKKVKKGLSELYGIISNYCTKDTTGNTMRQYIDYLLDEIFKHQRKSINQKKERLNNG